MIDPMDESQRCAVILAGGEGLRLRSLTRRIAGDERPKQFCALVGSETLLDETRRRVALAVPPERTVVVVVSKDRYLTRPAHALLGMVEEAVLGGAA